MRRFRGQDDTSSGVSYNYDIADEVFQDQSLAVRAPLHPGHRPGSRVKGYGLIRHGVVYDS